MLFQLKKLPEKNQFDPLFKIILDNIPGLTLKGDSGEEVALWLLTSLCTSAKREMEVAL